MGTLQCSALSNRQEQQFKLDKDHTNCPLQLKQIEDRDQSHMENKYPQISGNQTTCFETGP